MEDVYAGFVDAGFLRAEGAKTLGRKSNLVQFSAMHVVRWLRELRVPHVTDNVLSPKLIRVYWYDGAFEPSHKSFRDQHSYHEAIANVPGIQLRLGQIVERPSKLRTPIHGALRSTANSLGINPEKLIREFNNHWTFHSTSQQKGVDTLITLDMVRLASRGAFEMAIIISGDRDLAEVVRTVQDYGISVFVATPNTKSVARELLQIADGIVEITPAEIERMLPDRSAPNQSTSRIRLQT